MSLVAALRLLSTSLGAGCFGTVFEADDEVRGRVAAKRISRKPGESDADWQQRKANLTEEGRLQALAEHENIVPVYQVLEDDTSDEIYLIMKHCTRGSLGDLSKKGPIPAQETRRYLSEIARGVASLHSRSMLHRDIKPSNILIDSDGKALVADFGQVTDQLMHGYASVGDYIYLNHLAKEIYDGDPTSVKSDVWALGMTAYRLLHGESWYDSLPPPRDLIRNGGYAKKLPWLPHVPDQWRRFVRKCMHDDKGLRTPSMNAVLEELAVLPVEQNWSCRLDLSLRNISWEQIRVSRKSSRKIVVNGKPSGSIFLWEAISLPHLTRGNSRKIGNGSAPNWVNLLAQVKKFFDGYE